MESEISRERELREAASAKEREKRKEFESRAAPRPRDMPKWRNPARPSMPEEEVDEKEKVPDALRKWNFLQEKEREKQEL